MAARLYSPVASRQCAEMGGAKGEPIFFGISPRRNSTTIGSGVRSTRSSPNVIRSWLPSRRHVSDEFGISLSELHYDPTHVVLHGAYESSESRGDLGAADRVRSDDALPLQRTSRRDAR